MEPSLRIRTLVADTWHATYANPSLLVFGLFISVLALSTHNLSFFQTELFQNGSFREIFLSIPWPLILLLLTIFLTQTLTLSQIFILSASDFFRRPNLLTLHTRFTKALTYTGAEILGTLPIIGASPLLFIPSLLHLDPIHPLSFLLIGISLGIFVAITLFTIILKRLTIGYLILSPLHLRSSIHLAVKILLRYRSFSILSFFLILMLTLLFTILENLVMLQSAFIGQYLSGIAPVVCVYTVLLLANTFMSVFMEVFWLHFFLTLTNKNKKMVDPLPMLHEQLEEVPLIPS